MSKRQYSDAERAEYWKNKAMGGGGSHSSNRGGYKKSYGKKDFKSDGKRRSHCRTIVKDGVLYVTGWKVGKQSGFRTFFVAPAKSPKVRTSKRENGGKEIEWHSCRVTVVNKTHNTKGLFPGWIDAATKRVFVSELNLLINPQTGFISYLEGKDKKRK